MTTPEAQEKRRAKSSNISELKKTQKHRLQMLAVSAGFGTQAALAAATGINFRTIGSYWSGHRRITNAPPDLNASKIVDALNAAKPKRKTTVAYLLIGEGPMYVTEMPQSGKNVSDPLRIKLFSTGDAEYLLRLKAKDSFAWSREIAIMNPELILGTDYAELTPILFTAPDRSMEPMIPLGAVALVEFWARYVAGDTVLACPPGLDAAIVRQYQVKQKARAKMRLILHPLNDADGAFEDIEIEDRGCIIGPVKLIISRPK